MMMVINAWTAV